MYINILLKSNNGKNTLIHTSKIHIRLCVITWSRLFQHCCAVLEPLFIILAKTLVSLCCWWLIANTNINDLKSLGPTTHSRFCSTFPVWPDRPTWTKETDLWSHWCVRTTSRLYQVLKLETCDSAMLIFQISKKSIIPSYLSVNFKTHLIQEYKKKRWKEPLIITPFVFFLLRAWDIIISHCTTMCFFLIFE